MAAGAKKGGLWERAGRVEAQNGVLNVREKNEHSGAFSVFSRDGRPAKRGGHRAKKRKMPPRKKRPKKKTSLFGISIQGGFWCFCHTKGRAKQVGE